MKTMLTTTLALVAMATAASAIDLDSVDKDGDNMLSSKEFLATFGPDRGIETFRFMDKNNDGFVDMAEFWASMMGSGPLKN